MRGRAFAYLASMLCLAGVTAVGALQDFGPELAIRVQDSESGVALANSVVVVESLKAGDWVPFESVTDGAGWARLKLEDGTYRVHVVRGQRIAQSAETVMGDNMPSELVFNLDPESRPKKARKEAFDHQLDGYVVNEETGQPVAKALVRSGDRTTFTDENGYFELPAPTPKSLGEVDVEIIAEGLQRHIRRNVEVYPYGGSTLRFRLNPGKGEDTLDERQFRRRDQVAEGKTKDCEGDCNGKGDPKPFVDGGGPDGLNPPVLPKNIRVGRNCSSRTTCTSVEVYSLDTYTARVLSSEWYGCWGNVTGGMDSLRAGSVAVRSYGVSFVYAPATSTYDICDTTSCQVFGSTTNTNSANASNDTSRYILSTSAGSVARSEYSAENNNAGCGDGFSGTGTSWPCINDPVCAGFATFGHGRGLCQWGSARWATGKRLSSSQACTSAAPNTNQPTKNWSEILAHYYPTYTLEQGATASITSLTSASPNIAPGISFTLNYGISATASATLLIGASVAPTGTTTFYNYAAGDIERTVPSGTSTQTRTFVLATNAPVGVYDLYGTLYFDRDNTNTVSTGDFVVADRVTTGAFTADPSTVLVFPNVQGESGQGVTLAATLTRGDGSPVVGRAVTFSVSATNVGTAGTNASGVASVGYTIGVGGPASFPMSANFAGGSGLGAASANATLWRVGPTAIQTWNLAGRRGGTAQFVAKVTHPSTGLPMGGATVQFRTGTRIYGTGVSDNKGTARLSWAVPAAEPVGTVSFTAEILALPFLPSSATGTLEITRRGS